jgi:dihydroxy-acid dehydratase
MDARTVSALFNGAMIGIDSENGAFEVELSEAALAGRRKAWKAPPNPYQSGALRKYADQVALARKGAATHSGGVKEAVCHAEI